MDAAVERVSWLRWVRRYRSDPVLWVREVLGADPYHWQADVLRTYARGHRRISIRSGHRVGKTALLAWLGLYQLLLRFPQKTIVMAPTEKQLFNALMPEIRTWISVLPPAVAGRLSVQTEYIRLRHRPESSFLAAVAVRADNPESVAGAHSGGPYGPGHVLIIADEASGMPDSGFEALAGSMAGPYACTVLAGNPVRRTGFFHATHTRLAAKLPEGRAPWEVDPSEVEPGSWVTFKVSSLDNPNVSPDLAADIARRYGEHSNPYRVRVLGEFPLVDQDSIVPYDLVISAVGRDVQPVDGPMIWGLDVAAGGEDRTALVRRRANVVPSPPMLWHGLDAMGVVGRVKDLWDRSAAAERPNAIYVDSIIWGAGVVSRLRELGLPAVGVNVSEMPSMRNSSKYRNQRTENWFRMREWFEARDVVIPNDEDFIEEITSQTYEVLDSSGVVLATPKKRVISLLGRSPDAADALMLTFSHQAGLGMPRTDWGKPLARGVRVV